MKRKNSGFTLLELMIAAAIIIVALAGLLSTYVACFELNETTRNTNLALNAAQKAMEEIRSSTFSGIASAYNGYNFAVSGMAVNKSVGRVYVDSTDPSLLNITIGVCWEQKGDKIIGECQEVSGALVFSDANSNNVLDSPVELSTLMAQR
ncbi:MAG: prepilin-type N-terminal cleavage/methylation domain-containing protein [Candidatus Omnitrophica bacterium]|nr:prepilin-type N-terminal cleavage/methylation domain-containing protein [Candidatus Omnitrophota bacterium]